MKPLSAQPQPLTKEQLQQILNNPFFHNNVFRSPEYPECTLPPAAANPCGGFFVGCRIPALPEIPPGFYALAETSGKTSGTAVQTAAHLA